LQDRRISRQRCRSLPRWELHHTRQKGLGNPVPEVVDPLSSHTGPYSRTIKGPVAWNTLFSLWWHPRTVAIRARRHCVQRPNAQSPQRPAPPPPPGLRQPARTNNARLARKTGMRGKVRIATLNRKFGFADVSLFKVTATAGPPTAPSHAHTRWNARCARLALFERTASIGSHISFPRQSCLKAANRTDRARLKERMNCQPGAGANARRTVFHFDPG